MAPATTSTPADPLYPTQTQEVTMPKSKFPKFDSPTLMLSRGDGGEYANDPQPAITLFSGLGSSSKALRDLGYDPLAHDFMPEAVATLNANDFDAVGGDIREVDFTLPMYEGTKVVIGGPPCQPFSQGGRNAGENDPRDMIPDFIRCVAQTLPELFILENVRGLAGPRHREYLQRRISEFEAIGYVVDWRVLDSADFGVGQSRKRLFVIGVRKDLNRAVWWPAKQARTTMAQALGWDPRTVWERNQEAPEAARCKGAHDQHWTWPLRQPSTTVVGSFRPEVQAAPGYRSTGDGPRQNAPGSVVTTEAERLVLQGMPADWKVEGSKTKRGLQIGNSCPNPLLKALVAVNTNR
jgi:DNA (cytosine-5)-methyltransferase 1